MRPNTRPVRRGRVAGAARRQPATAPPRVRLLRLTTRDAKAFLSLVDGLADYEKLRRPSPAAKRRLVRDLGGSRARFEGLLAFADGTPVGYAVFFETYSTFRANPTLYLEDLFVLPAHRGLGIGARLFRAVLSEAKRRGCGRMDWTVLDWNTPAAKFYRKLGAKKMKEWELFRLEREDFARALGAG